MRSQFHTSTHLQSQKSRRWPAAKTHVGFRRRRQELGDKATPAGATFMRVPPGSHAYTSAAELNAPLRGKLICCSQVPPATAPSANGDCSDFYAGGVAVYSGLRVTDRAGAPGDGSGGCRRCGARCRRGGAPGRLPRQLRAMQGPARASRPAPLAPRHRHLQVCIFFSGTPSWRIL